MVNIKFVSIAIVLMATASATTYMATSHVYEHKEHQSSSRDACKDVLAELQAEKEKREAKEREFQKYTSGHQFELGRGKRF